MESRNAIVLGVGGTAAALAAGWIAAQRRDSRAIAADPKGAALFAEFGGRRSAVRAADGTALWARTFGPEDAPTIVFVHGWTCAAEFWKLQVEALAGERRIVTFDLRGHGQSERPPDGNYSIQTFARDLNAVLEATVPAGERALLVGHSLGAMTIVTWAAEHADLVDDRISAAVLLNTGVGDLISESLVIEGVPDGFARLQRITGEGVLRARAPTPASSTPVSNRVIRRYVVGPDASPAQAAFCEQLVLSCPADVRGAVGGTLSRLDLKAALAELRVPTLVISGGRDRLTPPAHAELMAESLPDVLEVVEIPRSGHMSPIEFPTEVNGLLAELAGTSAAPVRSA
jgi:pimeloyl-ACP methyl ester carboxylesterase